MKIDGRKKKGLKPKLSKSVWLAVICVMTLFTGLSGCGKTDLQGNKTATKKPPLVTAASVQSGAITQTLQLNGAIEPIRLARLASPAEGPVINLRVREGDGVKAGEILLTIGRKTGVDALIASLKEELKKEEENLNRTRQLVKSTALPGEQLDIAKASFERVKAQLVRAKETEQDYEVAAPFSGMVSRMLVNEGDFVAPRAGLVEIYEPDTLVLRSTVQERYAARLKKEMQAEIGLDAYPDRRFTGKVTRLYPYLDGRLRTRTIEIRINEPVDLLPGMFGRIRLTIASIPDALTIPVPALRVKQKGQAAVFVFKEGKAVERKVTTGIEEKGRIQILSGLIPGDQVLVAGHEKLKNGAEIRLSGQDGAGLPRVSDRGKPVNNEAGDR